jgi:hypothetical protein
VGDQCCCLRWRRPWRRRRWTRKRCGFLCHYRCRFRSRFAVANARAGTGSGAFAVALAFAQAFAIAFAFVAAFGLADIGAAAFTAAFVGVGAIVLIVSNDTAIRCRRQGVFLALFLSAMIVTCLMIARLLAPSALWQIAGPLLLFLGLLTVLNAPFDWASLGLTRALLRRGLELGGWGPYLLPLVDAALAGVIIAALALTMVIGVQTFDELAVHGGGSHP